MAKDDDDSVGDGDSKDDDDNEDNLRPHTFVSWGALHKGGGATSGLIGTDTEVPFFLRNILGHQMRTKLLIDNYGDGDESSMMIH